MMVAAVLVLASEYLMKCTRVISAFNTTWPSEQIL
jgi:hypothetical protein